MATTSNSRGFYVDESDANSMKFYTGYGKGVAGKEVTLDNFGNLLVGKTATDSDVVGVELLPAGQVYITANNTLPFYINRKGTSGNNEFARFSDDGATRGTIASSFDNELTISASGTNSSGILFSQSNQVRPMKNGSTSSGTIDLGSGNGQWKDLYLSGGIQFDTRSNKLDDYEEGTGTPVVKIGTTAVTLQGGSSYFYTKIGREVVFAFEFRATNLNGGSGEANIALPFVTAAAVYAIGGIRIYNGAVVGTEFLEAVPSHQFVHFKTNVNNAATGNMALTTNAYYFGSIVFRT
jgi:hypothetical protein